MRLLVKNKKAALDKKKLLIIIGIAVILLIGIAWYFKWFGIFSSKSEIEASGVWAEITKGADWVSNYLFGVPFNQKAKSFLGIVGWGAFLNFWPKLVIGLIAGLLMWIGAFITGGILKGMEATIFAAGYKDKEGKDKKIPPLDVIWLDFFAGGLGRVVIIGVTYAALMQVAIINKFIELITFYDYTPWIVKPFILAVYLGYLPAAIEGYFKWRDYRARYRYMIMMKAGKVVQREIGRI